MTNTNCLENIVCPQCGHTDSFIVEVKTRADVNDEGAVTFGEMRWDEWSFIECKNCETGGTVDEFTRDLAPDEHKTYNVHIYREMRLFFPGIKAPSHEVAALWASRKSDDEAAFIDECDGENLAALVDVVGDDDFRQSRTIEFQPDRKYAQQLQKALVNLCAQIEGVYGDIDLREANAILSKTSCGSNHEIY